MPLSVGYLIYSGTMPLLKIYGATFFGFLLAKRGFFPPAAARGASQVSMNLSLPCLIFANVVPAFTPSNISSIGPLILVAYFYQAIGFGLGLVIREFMYVPRNFWTGIVVLCGMSNWGNLPNAVVLTVTGQAPFNPATDTTLGVSYVSIFVVCYHITFWVFGAANALSWDYLPGVPQKDEAERRVPWNQKPIGGWVHRVILRRSVESVWAAQSEEAPAQDDVEMAVVSASPTTVVDGAETPGMVTEITEVSRQVSRTSHISEKARTSPSIPFASARRLDIIRRVLRPLKAAANSITITLVCSLIIAVVNNLKALFVDISSQGGPSWHGPDGRPPLSFVIDTAAFIGGITVPLALILLGASFARLHIPRPLSRLPFAAMFSAALVKMAIIPVVGVLTVQAMTRGGLMDRNARAERFVAMFLAGTPASVNQLIVASLYSTDGNVDTLSAFLLVQYVLMFFASAMLTAIALALL